MVLFYDTFNHRRPRMAGFDLALARVRDEAAALLVPDRINQLARAEDHTFRNTILTPGNTLCWFVRQIAHGKVACTAVHRLAGETFSDAAWCQARDRLPIELIQQVHRSLIDQVRRDLDQHDDVGDDSYRWRGHRLHVVDGTSDTMPDTPALREHYGVSGRCRAELGFANSSMQNQPYFLWWRCRTPSVHRGKPSAPASHLEFEQRYIRCDE
jgi:hypothetical protein